MVGEVRRKERLQGLDAAVLEAAVLEARGGALRISWNVTWESFAERCFPSAAARLVGGRGVSPGRVVAEVGEEMLPDPQAFAAAVERWRGAGFLVALDDFGRGGSNLALAVEDRRPDIIKVDGGVVGRAGGDPSAGDFVRSMVEDLAGCMARAVVMEGVETGREVSFCESIGGNVWMQGHALGRPTGSAPRRKGRWSR